MAKIKVFTLENFQQVWTTIKTLYATKDELANGLNAKVDKVEGKTLTTNDYSNADKAKVDGIAEGAQVNVIESVKVNGNALPITNKGVNVDLSAYATNEALAGKVDKAAGKDLSSNDYTDDEKAKLAGIATGAQTNVIESVKVNGEAVAVEGKAVDVTVPTKVSELTQDVAYLKAADIEGKVDKIEGKGLTTNDLTDDLKAKYDKAVSDVAGLTATGGQANVIASISVNGTAVEPDVNKNVAITVPTKVSALENDSKFLVAADVEGKVDKVEGKGLSSEDYTAAEKTKLSGVEAGAQVNKLEAVSVNGTPLVITEKGVNVDLSAYAKTADVEGAYVAKEEGKGLSTEDYTTADKTKLAGIAVGAQVNVIEAVKVNGTALAVTGKAVNVDLGAYATNADLEGKVDKAEGKGLSANDFSNVAKAKLDGVAEGAQVNVLESVKVNGAALAVTAKGVDITVPTKVSQITNDSGYQTAAQVTSAISTAVADITSFEYELVDSLPEAGVKGTIYLIPVTGGSGQNIKEEYIWIGDKYEMLGTTEMDLSGYWSKAEFEAATTDDIDAIMNPSA